jgi:hypothetical protein
VSLSFSKPESPQIIHFVAPLEELLASKSAQARQDVAVCNAALTSR